MTSLENALRTATRTGIPLIIDGATGTELQKRGVPMDGVLWNALVAETHPDILAQVHQSYLDAGAQIIITNTFSTSRYMLAYGGQESRFESLNRQAARLALQTRDRNGQRAWVAGAISNTTLFQEKPDLATIRQSHRDQAALFAEEGVDLIALEMMEDVEHTAAALAGAALTGLPVWVGFSVVVTEQGDVQSFLHDTPFAQILDGLDLSGAQAVGIMHSLTEDVAPALAILRERWNGPLFVYAHSGEFKMPDWQFSDIIAPVDYARTAAQWIASGVGAVGACCGLGPAHIRQLVQDVGRQEVSWA